MSKPKRSEVSVKAHRELLNLTDDLTALDRKEFGLRVWSKLGSKSPPTLSPEDEENRARIKARIAELEPIAERDPPA